MVADTLLDPEFRFDLEAQVSGHRLLHASRTSRRWTTSAASDPRAGTCRRPTPPDARRC
jgi:hypothetical protein